MLLTFIRTLLLFILVVIVMRIMGKRQIGQLQPYELAVAIMISELAAIPMQNIGIPILNGIIPILTILIIQLIFSLVSIKSIKLRGLICGKPTILIENGKISEPNLQKELYTINELLEQLRIKDVPNIADVEFAILETNGQLSVITKSQKRYVVPEDLGLETKYEGLPLDLVVDGRVIEKNLEKAQLSVDWLKNELRNSGIFDTRDVFFANIDTNGHLYFQKRNTKKEDESV